MQIWLRCFSVSYGLQSKALAWHVKASMSSGLSLTIVHFSFDYNQVKFLIDPLSTVLPVYIFMHAILSTWNAIPPIPSGKLFLILQTLLRKHFYKIFPTLPDGSNSSFQSVVSGPVASTASRNLLGIHILGPHPRNSEGRARQSVFLQANQMILMHANIQKQLLCI